jgi:hypothetical protein
MRSSSRVIPLAPDVLVHNEGTLFLFCPLTNSAKTWVNQHVDPDAQWFGNALVVETRYALGLANAMNDAGLKLGMNIR